MERGDNFNNSSNFLDRTITTWMFAYIVLAIAICFFTPYPILLVVSLVIIVLMMVSIKAFMLKKSKLDETNPNNNTENKSSRRITGRFNDIALSLYNIPIKQVFGYNSLKFYCMYCGKDHKKRKCSRCGSIAVRTG